MTIGYHLRPEADSALTTEDALRVREQLSKILESHPFAQSKRYPALLHYIVEHTLNGEAHLLKERTLGVEVFARPLDYETSEDPIVRVSAAEIRKRLAQYYQDPCHDGELRIELRTGSYIPDFYFIEQASVPGNSQADSSAGSCVSNMAAVPIAASRSKRFALIWISSVVATLVAATLVFVGFAHREDSLRLVWGSVLNSPAPVVISVGEQVLDQPSGTMNPDSLNAREHLRSTYALHFSDVRALTRIIDFLDDYHHSYRLQTAQATTYTDLRQGPAILIGAFGNQWTLRAVQPLRYRFARDDQHHLYWVEDQKDSRSKKWVEDMSEPYSVVNQDFAIVARFVDPETREPVVILAGVGENGTKSASEFLTDHEDVRAAGKSLLHKANFEIVIRTQVINGASGPPQIVAIETW